ncbi:MAG: hemerythrin domain-containing protein [Peptococcaceae bacterium]|nr:hemerythrin domain-containing protein [Peptococcaceae bacterium]
MTRTERFRKQHTAITEVVTTIKALLQPELVVNNSELIRKNLSKLMGKLSVHLAAEDEVLYPELLRHDDGKVVQTAQKYLQELGDIKERFSAYCSKWAVAPLIKNKPEEFIKETVELFRTLGKRIDLEEKELYRLADSL